MQIRPPSAIFLAAVALAAAASSTHHSHVASAYVASPTPRASSSSSSSTFGGRALSLPSSSSSRRRGDMCMKKGKPNVPPQMRGQYKKMQEMQSMREQMIAAQTAGEDGLPVFNLYVRTKVANVWYPCGSFKGDDRSAALASNYRDQGLMAGISKKQLDGGVAGSLYRDLEKLKDSVCRGYPQLRKARNDLEFGYKLSFKGLKDDQKEMTIVEPKETKGFFDNVKGMFS